MHKSHWLTSFSVHFTRTYIEMVSWAKRLTARVRLELVALWLIIMILTVITAIAGLSSSSRADCSGSSAVNITDSPPCSTKEEISATLHQHTPYFLSAHTVILQAALSASLLVFKPALRAMMWTELGVSSTLGALQCNIALAGSPSLVSAFAYVRTSLSVRFEVVFVILVAALSTFSPMAISAAYRPHTGPRTVSASIVVGGGVGPNFGASLGRDVVPGGIATGRAVLNEWTLSNRAISNMTYAPFVPEKSILDIWSTQVETAVARQRLYCGPSAPTRVWNSDNIVTVGPTYFSSDSAVAEISFAGQSLGSISNDPQITAVYINASTTIVPGSVETESTVIFLAANGTMEGAQWRINSNTRSSRISYIDVLVCTSAARLEISECNVERGTFTSCHPSQTPRRQGKNASFGGLDAYVTNPISTSIALSASPVLACQQVFTRLPMWSPITAELLASQLPPLSFLTSNTLAQPYSVPLTYVTNAFFRQTAHALVQGMTTAWTVYQVQPVQLTAVFATSIPALLYVIMGVVAVCALMATHGSMTTRRSTELDAPGLMSRSGELAEKLESFVDDTGEMSEDVEELEVRCVQNHHALVLVVPSPKYEDSAFLRLNYS
jgi:hypothetical protein